MPSVYRGLFGHDAVAEAIRTGLETSEFGTTYPGLDMVAVGPTIERVHSPDERLEIASVGKVYDLLVTTPRRVPTSPLRVASPTGRPAAPQS